MPGGFGTLDELFEVMTLIQTKKITLVPVILVGTKFWAGLRTWVKETMLDKYGNISAKDMDLMPIVDTPEEVSSFITKFYSEEKNNQLSPNYNF